MPVQASDTPTWLDLLSRIWPMMLALAALLWASIELRVRRLIREAQKETEAAIEKSARDVEVKWRSELQKPIGDMGIDAIRAEEKVDDHEKRISDLEFKIGPVWKMIERRIEGLLPRSGPQKDDQ